jgi:nitronate monooxygenase
VGRMADVPQRLARCPVVVAPMAGGPSTAGLVIAASAAGALGFLAAGPTEVPLRRLLADVAAVTSLPLIAAGAIMGRQDVTSALAAGAVAVQCGTAFLRCPESGAHPLHKAALADPRFPGTAVTRSFTGRPARGLVNRFMLDHPDAPPGYPEVHFATRPLRAAAAAAGDTSRMNLWAGEGYRAATTRPAAEIVAMLTDGTG